MVSISPKIRRLQSDYEKIRLLAAKSRGELVLLDVLGKPPTTYKLEYHCPGLTLDPAGEIVILSIHQVEIRLGQTYPFTQPTARFITPIFNPHVFSSGNICLGRQWSPAETLDILALKIGALIQLDPKVLDFNSPANGLAAGWAKRHVNELPLGNISFQGSTPAASAGPIVWA